MKKSERKDSTTDSNNLEKAVDTAIKIAWLKVQVDMDNFWWRDNGVNVVNENTKGLQSFRNLK